MASSFSGPIRRRPYLQQWVPFTVLVLGCVLTATAVTTIATRQEVAEVIFQQVTYGGMPVVVEALEVFRRVLEERGEWEA